MKLSYTRRQRLKRMPGALALRFWIARTSLAVLTSAATRVCIDGFPRSGNTFAYRAVHQFLDVTKGQIAHHTHSVVNLDRAIARGIPTFVPVREPVSCCLSLAAVEYSIAFDDALQAYIEFHEACLSRLPHVTLVPFPDLIARPWSLIERVALALNVPVPVPSARADVTAGIEQAVRSGRVRDEYGSIPDPARARRKAELWAQSQPATTTRLVERSQRLHAHVLASAPSIVGEGG